MSGSGSGLENATFVVDLDTSQLVAGSNKAKQTFQQMADSGVQSMQTIQINADKVVVSNSKVADSAKQASDTMKSSFSSVVAPMTGLVASSASLYFSFDNLDKVTVRLERSQLAVSRAQAAVTKLQQEGKTDTDQYTLAQQALQVAQDRYNSQSNDLIQTQVMIGLQFTTMATSVIPGVIKAVQALQVSQEALGVALEATMPWLLAITAAVLAWEYAITPLVKSQTGLDLGIQSNISKLIQQHTQVTTNTGSFDDLTGTLGSVDGALGSTTSSFDTLGNSITTATGKVNDMMNAFSQLKNGGTFSDPGVSLLGKNDVFTQTMAQIDQIHNMESDIQKLMDNHVDKQTAINMVMDHYLTLLQEEAFQQNESNTYLEQKVKLLNQAKDAAVQLLDTSKQQTEQDKKKADIINGLAQQSGLSPALIAMTFQPGGYGNPFNPALQELYNQQVRNFGSTFVNSPLGQQLGMFGARPFYDGVGYGGISNNGVNVSSPVGGLKNDDIHNMLVDIVANTHLFGENYGRDKDLLRQAVDNGEALQQAQFEQRSPQWQKFYALKQAGLFNGDPNLSIEENLANAEKQYDTIFAPLRSDVASALEAATSTIKHVTGFRDARMLPWDYYTYSYRLPTQDELNRAIADSLFANETDFQNKLSEAKTKLGLSESDIINSLANTLTNTDIQAEIDFKDRLAAMSTGVV